MIGNETLPYGSQQPKTLTTFESDVHAVSASAEQIHAFLSNLQHLEHLLPHDRIENVNLEEKAASFKIKGLAEINIALSEDSDQKVVYTNSTVKPFPFQLIVEIGPSGENTDVKVLFTADINNFMGMMMKKPLTNFLNALAMNLQKHYQSAQ